MSFCVTIQYAAGGGNKVLISILSPPDAFPALEYITLQKESSRITVLWQRLSSLAVRHCQLE